jgi:tetratricopeptide (TPR) repeat protein
LVFARSLIPSLQGSLLVWVMYPGDMADPAAYAGLMREVLQHEWPFPWCHHIRFVLRDNGAQPALEPGLSGIPRVAWLAPDLSTGAMERAFEEDINDESLPLEERVQSLLLTAGMDQSHQRYATALEKYHLLFQHYSTGGDLAMAAVALNGMGEVYRDQHDETGAGACFEAALVAASDGPHPSTPILLNVCLNLGNLRMQQERWQEAEGYFDCAQKLATVLRYADVKVMILEQLGLAQSRQQKLDASRATWKAGAVVARQINRTDWETIHLQRLREQFAATGDARGLHDVEQQLAAAVPAAGA